MVFKHNTKKTSPEITIPDNLDNNDPRRDIHRKDLHWQHGDLGRGLKGKVEAGRGEAGRGAEKNVELDKNQ